MVQGRPPLRHPILVGIVAIAFTVAVLVAWNVVFTRYYLVSDERATGDLGVGYWLLLSLGDVLLVGVIAALVLFLVATMRQWKLVRRQNEFIDSVTHELKSPLASLRLGLETLEVRELEPDVRGQMLGMMKQDVERLRSFIEHLLEASRVGHSREAVELEPTHLPELLERSVARVCERHRLDPGCVMVSVELADPDEPVRTDPMALETIVENLLDNAAKYCDGKPEIRVRLHEDAGDHVLEVVDAGIGIPRSELRKVFHRFHRVDESGWGTGLGLHVVRALVGRLGGRVTADSPGLGHGATFTVRLPRRP